MIYANYYNKEQANLNIYKMKLSQEDQKKIFEYHLQQQCTFL